jgi:TPR repeat protein
MEEDLIKEEIKEEDSIKDKVEEKEIIDKIKIEDEEIDYLIEGNKKLREGNFEEALELYQKSKNTKSYLQIVYMIKFNQVKRDMDMSLEYINKAINEGSVGYGLLAEFYYFGINMKVDKEKAEKLYNEGIEKKDVTSYYIKGYILLIVEKDNEGVKLFEEGAKLGDYFCNRELGMHYEKKDIEKAKKYYEELIKIDNFDGYSLLGKVYLKEGEEDNAIETFKKGIEINEGDSIIALSNFYLTRNKLYEAKKVLKKGIFKN